MENINYLKKYGKLYIKEIFLSLFFLSLETVFSLLIFYILGKIIDLGVGKNDLDYILTRGLLMVLVTGLMAVCTIIRNRYSSIVSQSFGSDLRYDLYEKIQRLRLGSLDRYDKSEFLTRLTNDISQVQGFVHSLLRVFFKAPLLALGSIFLSFFLSFRLALILVLIIPICVILIYENLKISYPLFIRIQEAMDRLNLVLNEYLSGIQLVKSFNRQDFEEEKFKAANKEYMEANIFALRLMAVFSPLISLILNLGLVLIIYLGGISVAKGGLEIGAIVGFINYMGQISFGLIIVARFLTRGLRARTSFERIGEVFEMEEEDLADGEKIEGFTIKFEDLAFKYDKDSGYVLKNINLEIKEGESLGIIGSTGSGKSSLIKLIMGFYYPSQGDLKIGGHSIRDLDLKYLRENLGLVAQDSSLFRGKIRENISFGPGGGYEKYGRLAEADGFIKSFREGYESLVGEGGVNLSGGQKQRITIARALYKEARVIILDDSTSNLDLRIERKLMDNIQEEFKDRTIIIISQRINTVRSADRILVLDKGEVESIGSHKDLMEKSRVYRSIYDSQIGEVDRFEDR